MPYIHRYGFFTFPIQTVYLLKVYKIKFSGLLNVNDILNTENSAILHDQNETKIKKSIRSSDIAI